MTNDQQGQSHKDWEGFYTDERAKDFPAWPNEIMLKVIFGGYLRNRVTLAADARILDIGCGTGNNLLPFLTRGYECYGTEVTAAIAEAAQQRLGERGYSAIIKEGTNTSLPFPDNYFDLIVSINVIHYERHERGVKSALTEYCRVLKPDGALYLNTVGQEHEIYQKALVVGPHQFEIQSYDFRDGQQYFYFSNLKYLEFYLSSYFKDIELGRVTERLMTTSLEFLIAMCRQQK